ncbi:hypothetical protein [Aquimarina agarivorans]|uniref:hypothetical protein n=1 Tax=Aquimarina agarivorans TaxID=980584 RepID=UPI000248E9CE|nr:hypothetical protein [Aquimarina agarivorans]
MKTLKFPSATKLFVLIYSVIGLFLMACNNKPKVNCNTSEQITYTNDVAAVIEEKCFKCHAPDVYKQKASRNKIYDYQNLKKMAESGFLLGALTHKRGFVPMPYKANKKIDTCSIALISSWISTGMKK